jgi:hypothetical protein
LRRLNASIGTLNLLGIPAYDLYITELVAGCVHSKSSAVYGPFGPANSFIGGISQIGFYGPPRIYSATVTFHY